MKTVAIKCGLQQNGYEISLAKNRYELSEHSQKFFTWAKNHVCCNQFDIFSEEDLYQDEAFVDFFLTGAQCTSSIKIEYLDLSQAMVDFVKKFMDLKNCDEYQIVESIFINHNKSDPAVGLLKHNFIDFLVKEESVGTAGTFRSESTRVGATGTTHVFEFINDNIRKKLQLTTKFFVTSNGNGFKYNTLISV
ncbi:hypothetical protein Ddc_23897 [Ditylenchus destructor]|nr:hypothetical protein Ddc_23897 [Ditylenchus destructor]